MTPTRITLHCSGVPFGTLEGVRRFHVQERGWDDIGYHFLITNGDPGRQRHDGVDRSPEKAGDGLSWAGRPLGIQGAHVRGHNEGNVGVCMVGHPGRFTEKQYRRALSLISGVCLEYDIPPEQVFGHNELDPLRTCPGVDMTLFRAALRMVAS